MWSTSSHFGIKSQFPHTVEKGDPNVQHRRSVTHHLAIAFNGLRERLFETVIECSHSLHAAACISCLYDCRNMFGKTCHIIVAMARLLEMAKMSLLTRGSVATNDRGVVHRLINLRSSEHSKVRISISSSRFPMLSVDINRQKI